MQEVTVSGIVSGEFNYTANTFTLNDEGKCLAFVSNIDRNNHLIYMQPESDIQYMAKLTEALE